MGSFSNVCGACRSAPSTKQSTTKQCKKQLLLTGYTKERVPCPQLRAHSLYYQLLRLSVILHDGLRGHGVHSNGLLLLLLWGLCTCESHSSCVSRHSLVYMGEQVCQLFIGIGSRYTPVITIWSLSQTEYLTGLPSHPRPPVLLWQSVPSCVSLCLCVYVNVVCLIRMSARTYNYVLCYWMWVNMCVVEFSVTEENICKLKFSDRSSNASIRRFIWFEFYEYFSDTRCHIKPFTEYTFGEFTIDKNNIVNIQSGWTLLRLSS